MKSSTAKIYSVYVLLSEKDEKHYVGLSANIDERLQQHNSGKVRSTKNRRPFKLIYKEVVGSLPEARVREKYLKSGAGRKFIAKVGGSPPDC